MRRIPLALALIGAVIAAGCSGGKTPAAKTDADAQKGVAGQFFFVNIFNPPIGGIITSDIGGINCGASAVSVFNNGPVATPDWQYTYTFFPGANACGTGGQTQFLWAQTVVLTATAQGGNAFYGWAGDCAGTGKCTFTAGADKTVVAIFGPPGGGHGNFMNPADHVPAYANGILDCARCHGPTLAGQSIAPSCATCHAMPPWPPPGQSFGPEYCATCHGPSGSMSTAAVHAIAGKTTWTVTPVVPAADTANLQFTFNVKVDGVNKPGILASRVYRYEFDATKVAASIVVPNTRTQLVAGVAAGNFGFVDNGAGNYTVTIFGQGPTGSAPLTGNRTFMVRGQDTAATTFTATQVFATPVSHFNAPARDFVSNQACVNCHGAQVFRERELPSNEWHHGANPYGVEACVVCHSVSGSTSRSMGGDRLTAYVHGVHNSHAMPPRDITANLDPDGTAGPLLPVPFTVTKADGVYARNDSLRIVAGSNPPVAEISSPWSVGFPGYLVNCSICHDTPARQAAIMTMPVSASTCFSCHDNWLGFPTFDPTTPQYAAKLLENSNWNPNVVAPHLAMALPPAGTPTPNACATCHNTTGGGARATVGDYHTLRITERNGVVYKGVDLSISQGDRVTMQIDSISYVDATTASVSWTARLDNVAVNPCNSNVATGPVFMGATASTTGPTAGQSASNMSLLQAYAQGNDWVNASVTGSSSPGQPPSAPTLLFTGQATVNGYTSCNNNIATSRVVMPTNTGGATKAVFGLQGKPQITFTDGSFTRVIQLRSTSPVKEFVVGTGAAPATLRRAIVSNDKCLACHPGSLYQHGGNRVDSVDLCVMCHNPAANEKNNRVGMGVLASEAYDGKVGETYDLRTMVHAIHSAGETSAPLVYYRSNGIYAFGSQAAIGALPNWPGAGTNIQVFGATVPTLRNHNEIVVHYPRALNDCNACHINGSEIGFGDQTQRMAVTVDSGGTTNNNLVDDVLRGAGAQSCTTCHQFGPTFTAPWTPLTGPQLNANIQAHVNTYGFAPQAFPAGRGTLINFATCGYPTCP